MCVCACFSGEYTEEVKHARKWGNTAVGNVDLYECAAYTKRGDSLPAIELETRPARDLLYSLSRLLSSSSTLIIIACGSFATLFNVKRSD